MLQGFTSGTAAAAAGLTLDQLRKINDSGLVVPSVARATGRGTSARWSYDDVVRLALIKSLRAFGDPNIRTVHAALAELEKTDGQTGWILEATSGRRFDRRRSADAQTRTSPVTVQIDVDELHRAVARNLSELGLLPPQALAA